MTIAQYEIMLEALEYQMVDDEKELKKMRERKKKKRDPRFIGISKLLRKGG